LIAEEVNGRFLNVIDILNGNVPLIALQMQAIKVGDLNTVIFTKVVDEIVLGSEFEEEEEIEAATTDRTYWEAKASKDSLGLADDLLNILREFDPSLSLTYKKHYVGIAKEKEAFNFVIFKPKKSHVNAELKIPHSDELDARIKAGGLEILEYSRQWNRYRIHLTKADLVERRPLVAELMQIAYNLRTL
jgi:hypothetical protein